MFNNGWFKLATVSLFGIVLSFGLLLGINRFEAAKGFNMNGNTSMQRMSPGQMSSDVSMQGMSQGLSGNNVNMQGMPQGQMQMNGYQNTNNTNNNGIQQEQYWLNQGNNIAIQGMQQGRNMAVLGMQRGRNMMSRIFGNSYIQGNTNMQNNNIQNGFR